MRSWVESRFSSSKNRRTQNSPRVKIPHPDTGHPVTLILSREAFAESIRTLNGRRVVLGLSGGVTINEPITANGTGAAGRPGAVANIAGNNAIASDVVAEVVNSGTFGLGSESGTLTIDGNVDMQRSQLSLDGAGDLVINGVIGGVGTGPTISAQADQLDAYAYHIANAQRYSLLDNILDNAPGNLLQESRLLFVGDAALVMYAVVREPFSYPHWSLPRSRRKNGTKRRRTSSKK